jgi:class 3 adenylate cyclase
MIPLSKSLEQWCRHKSGVEKVSNQAGWTRTLASAELNEDAGRIISSFANKEFEGLVGFIDMRGFSALSQGMTPTRVHSIVAPFLSTVIDAARKYGCFIDKTIGDEVMVVMPWFELDTILSDACLPHRKVPIYELSYLLRNLITTLRGSLPLVRFSAGFAFGNLILDRVGGDEYHEWTVYGNCVNAAKRLQSRPPAPEWSGHHVLAVGQLESELSDFRFQLAMWTSAQSPNDPLKRISMVHGREEFKGVGSILFAHSAIEANAEAQGDTSVEIAS